VKKRLTKKLLQEALKMLATGMPLEYVAQTLWVDRERLSLRIKSL